MDTNSWTMPLLVFALHFLYTKTGDYSSDKCYVTSNNDFNKAFI